MTDSKPQPQKAAKGGLNSEIQARIGHQLRAMYDDVVRQGVPDRFAELIRQLDASGGAAGTTAADHMSADKEERRD